MKINKSERKFNKRLGKIITLQLLIILSLLTFLIGIGKTSIKEIKAYRVSNAPQSPRDSVWASIPETTVQLGANAEAGGHGRPNISQTSEVKIKTAYNDSELFMRLKWKDPDVDDLHSYWELKGSGWVKHLDGAAEGTEFVEQDRLYMAWPIKDIAGRDGKTFSEAGCAASCHKVVAGGADKDKYVDTPGTLNNCGSCHKSSSTVSYNFSHSTNEGDGSCAGCHTNRSFNDQALYNGNMTTVAADHVLPSGGELDIWHWKAQNAAIGYMDDQVAANGKKRGNDASPSLEFDNKNGSDSAPAKIWFDNQDQPLSYVATRRDYNSRMITVGYSGDLTKRADGSTIALGTKVRRRMPNNVDANFQNIDIRTTYTRSNGYYEVVIRRSLNTGDTKDYQFTDLNSEHLFSLAITDQGETSHAGSLLQKLVFIKDTTAPSAKIIAPSLSSSVSSLKNFIVKWKSSDGIFSSGIDNHTIQYRKKGSSNWIDWLVSTEAESGVFGLNNQPTTVKAGDIFEFRAKSVDYDGNTGAWSKIASTVVPFDQKVFSFSTGWSSLMNNQYYSGSSKMSKSKKSYAAYSFKGIAVYLLSAKGPDKGKANIYIDDKFVKEIDLYNQTNTFRSIVFKKIWNAKSKHTVKIEVSGTKNNNSTGTKVVVDGIAVKP